MMMQSVISFLFPPKPGESKDLPIEITALPGLITFLDVALFRANEGQLTATTCSSHALLACWLDIKHQSQLLLQVLQQEKKDPNAKLECESFCRQCLETAMDAIERLSTDRLAQAANLSDPFESISETAGGHYHHNHHNFLSGIGIQGVSSGILESKEDIGRRLPSQKRIDCWESPRLHCPDYVWAEDSYQACQRWLRNLYKHPFYLKDRDALNPLATPNLQNQGTPNSNNKNSNEQPLHPPSERQASILIQLIQDDLPLRLLQFRQAMNAEEVVTKRLHLVKCEYRGPFRHFLEAHLSLLEAPSMDVVDYFLDGDDISYDSEVQEGQLQDLLETPELVEMLTLERDCEQFELDLGKALFPFSELARTLDHKKARIKAVPGVVEEDEVAELQETVRRLKCILCRKSGPETSTGIRPILVDLQSVRRDDEALKSFDDSRSIKENVADFLSQLECLSTLLKTRNAFRTRRGNHVIEFSASVVNGCTEEFDPELVECQLLDWFDMVERQQELGQEQQHIVSNIREVETKIGLADASDESLDAAKDNLEYMVDDRQQRLEILQDLVEDLCLREMNLHILINDPDPEETLILKETSALGFLGVPLQLAGEALPVG
ncbi:unnamed protein product [Cylindrotheca closterium]|uniref:Uncharacterized protein n=1 Tax=Cylindrotheca closterium TaxID=2856 RepID=A0AAD2CR71_9STRA|nr:unnamed protein product [Cylindrotheca closterium]